MPVGIEKFTYDINDKKKEYPLSVNIKFKNAKGEERIINYNRK